MFRCSFSYPNYSVRKLSYNESLEHGFSLSTRSVNRGYSLELKLRLYLLITGELVGKSVGQIPFSVALLFLNYGVFFFSQAAMKYHCQTEWQNCEHTASQSLQIKHMQRERTVEINTSVFLEEQYKINLFVGETTLYS